MDAVVITTYNRQQEVESLVKSIKQVFDGEIIVFDDGSEPPAKPDCHVQYYCSNHGRLYYWKLITSVFQYLKNTDFEYFWMLPDDVIISEDLFSRSKQLWNAINDPQKICLSVGHTHNRHYEPCWTFFQPVKMGEVVLTGWNDLCFMAQRRFLEELNYEIEKPLEGYDYRSSGVGRHISRTLYKMGFNQYHTNKSLCTFPANESRMREFEKSMMR